MAWDKGENIYHYIGDKKGLKIAQSFCASILTDLTQELLDEEISSQFFLVGSGARNMVTQNENQPFDFDYNLNIQKCNNINDCRTIKETVRKVFNKVLNDNDLSDCEDSTSSLTTKTIYFKDSPNIEFSIDICIVVQNDNGLWFRLIHEKTGNVSRDRYFWNEAPHSNNIKAKADKIKKAGEWQFVRDSYLKIKNTLLHHNDHNHPSFVCYNEAVNNVYNNLKQKHIL